MPLSDYAHWNEEAPIIWWQEEGRHIETAEDHYDPDDFLPDYEEECCEECGEIESECECP